MAITREIPLIRIYLLGEVYRFSNRSIELYDENNILRFYYDYLIDSPKTKLSLNVLDFTGEDPTFTVSLVNVSRFQDLAESNILDGALVEYDRYDIDNKVVISTITGIVRSYSWDVDSIKITAGFEEKDIFIKIPENIVNENSFNEIYSGIADSWDTAWTHYWVTDEGLKASKYVDAYWNDARMTIKTINTSLANRIEVVERRVTKSENSTGKVWWEVWREVYDQKTSGGKSGFGFSRKEHTTTFFKGYSGAVNLNASTSFVMEKNFIPEESDAVGEVYPIVYGPVEKMPLLHIAGSYRFCDDKYMLAGHPIYDSTSEEVLVYYDLDEDDVPGYDADVVGGNLPNPIKVTHYGRVTEITDTEHLVIDSIKRDNDADANDLLYGSLPHYADDFFNQGQVFIYPSGGGCISRRVYDFDYITGGIHFTPAITGGSYTLGNDIKIELAGYRIVGDTTDNLANKIAYVELHGTRTSDVNVERPANIPHLLWNLRLGLGSSKLYATFRGHKDDADGSITGIANSLITNPADIIKHFFLNYTLIRNNPNLIDIDSFNEARRKRIGWNFGGAIIEEEDGKDIVDRFCQQSALAYFWKNGKLKLKAIDFISPKKKFNFVENVNIYEGIKIKRSVIENIKNNIVVKYKYSWVKDDFVFEVRKNKDNDKYCKESAGKYGITEEEVIDGQDIVDFVTANNLANCMVRLLAETFYDATFEIPKSYQDLELGDIIAITHSIGADATGRGWDEKLFVVVELSNSVDSIEVGARSFII